MADEGIDELRLFGHAVRLAKGHKRVTVEGVQQGAPGIHWLRLTARYHLRAGLSLLVQPGPRQDQDEQARRPERQGHEQEKRPASWSLWRHGSAPPGWGTKAVAPYMKKQATRLAYP